MKCTISSICRLLLPAAVLACSLSTSAVAADDNHDIIVLSNRADLISGGDALVEVIVPPGIIQAMRSGGKVKIQASIDGVPVPDGTLALRADGRIYGLVTGLKVGDNLLTVQTPGKAMNIVITNHPIGGPVFAGTQLQPWICATTVATPITVMVPNTNLVATATTKVSGMTSNPTDVQCDTPTTYKYYYEPTSLQGSSTCSFVPTDANTCFVPYPTPSDPSTRPADAAIASVTNDQGATVKALIRVERGAIDRGIYEVITFYDPAQSVAPWSPPKGWNGKLLFHGGPGASASRFQSPPGNVTGWEDSIWDAALRKGYMTYRSSLNDNGTQSNTTLSAEMLMMVKEHIIETYGPIRYTMGTGCSGGSIQQHSIAGAYPGLLDGILPNCSYMDMITIGIEINDCGVLQGQYFATANGSALTTAQKNAILGDTNGVCAAWVGSFLNGYKPTVTNPITGANNCGAGFPAALVYDPLLRPNGVRCSLLDQDASLLGTFVDADGNTKTNLPLDNVGIEYGLKALQTGVISPEQFVQLNEGAGGYSNDHVWGPARMQAQTDAFKAVYGGALVSQGTLLAKVAIIDLRGDETASAIHANWRSLAQRDRLDKANGQHGNQVIWAFRPPVPGTPSLTPGTALALKAFTTMDQWLANIESDASNVPLEQQVINDKPAGTTDMCIASLGQAPPDIVDVGLMSAACPVKFQNSPRQAAGGPLSENIWKCQLKPLSFSDPDYTGVLFSANQEARLGVVFPAGVCDWTKAGVGQVQGVPTTFAAGPGGQPLGPEPEAFH
jgi:Tannase-like family of unknown function (DUF6351)